MKEMKWCGICKAWTRCYPAQTLCTKCGNPVRSEEREMANRAISRLREEGTE